LRITAAAGLDGESSTRFGRCSPPGNVVGASVCAGVIAGTRTFPGRPARFPGRRPQPRCSYTHCLSSTSAGGRARASQCSGCDAAFAQHRNLHFPPLADFEAKGEVAWQYGVYDHSARMSKRARFVIDQDGEIRWSNVSPVGVNPRADASCGPSRRWRRPLRTH